MAVPEGTGAVVAREMPKTDEEDSAGAAEPEVTPDGIDELGTTVSLAGTLPDADDWLTGNDVAGIAVGIVLADVSLEGTVAFCAKSVGDEAAVEAAEGLKSEKSGRPVVAGAAEDCTDVVVASETPTDGFVGSDWIDEKTA